MAKYLVETYYTCSFKVKHYLNDLNNNELSNLEKRDDGKFEILDVKLDNRKTKNLDPKNQKINSMDIVADLPKAQNVSKDIIKGLYKIRSTKSPKIRLLGSGPLIRETLEAAKLLKSDWGVDPDVWNVTSFSELRREAEDIERWNLTHPEEKPKKSHLEESLSKNNVPTVAVSDYVKMVSEQIGPYVPCLLYTSPSPRD